MVELIREAGVEAPVIVGGIIPPADARKLAEAGVTRVYTPKDFDLNKIMVDIAELVAEQVPGANERSRREPVGAGRPVNRGSRHQLAWKVVNFSSVPVWLAMILAPRSGVTKWMVERLVPLHMALGAVYTASLATGVAKAGEPPDFMRMESVQKLLQEPNSMLAAWTHYISFDLFVGRWIWEESMREGKPARISMLLCWWAGPMDLTTYLARRAAA